MNYLIILSGGTGSRMQSDIPKQYIEVSDKPIIFYTLNCFDLNVFNKIVIVVADEWKSYVQNIIEQYFCPELFLYAKAGNSRQESILNGLLQLSTCVEEDDTVIIHDAARACCSKKLIKDLLVAIENHDGAMPVLPVKDTVYQSHDGKSISNLLNRDELFCGQAPEVFKFGKYYSINKNLTTEELSNIRGSSEIAFRNGLDIVLIAGDENNFKITTPVDLERFKEIIKHKDK